MSQQMMIEALSFDWTQRLLAERQVQGFFFKPQRYVGLSFFSGNDDRFFPMLPPPPPKPLQAPPGGWVGGWL